MFLSACSDLKKSKQLNSLNKMMTSTEESAAELEENKIEEASVMMEMSSDLVEGIRGLENKRIKLDIALTFDRFKLMFDELHLVLTNYDGLLESIQLEKKVLTKLKKDINAGNGKRHKYDDYLAFEQKKVAKLQKAIAIYIERKTEVTNTYNELHNRINELLVEPFISPEVQ